MAPLRVAASVPWSFELSNLMFETDEEKWLRCYEQGLARYRSKTLKELEEILRQSEEAMLREVVNYATAYQRSGAQVSENACGTPGRLARLNRRLRHQRLRLDGKSHSEWTQTKEELQKDREILEQIKKEQSQKPRQQTLAKQIEEISSRLEEVEKKIESCRYMDESILPQIREEYIHPIISENHQQSVRIPFFGSTKDAFRRGENAIVSFPGVHGQAWEKLTEVSRETDSPIATSCIFLPDEKAPGYGQHDHDPNTDASCYCIGLYGKREKWACHWFSMWREQTFRAHAKGCNLLVVTKMDGSLGRSQEGEVRWLDEEKLLYKKVSIKDFAEMILKLPTK
eukprot:Skav234580  [mRNA]  locus=scaffold313:60718:61740:- [translate_table: standard]